MFVMRFVYLSSLISLFIGINSSYASEQLEDRLIIQTNKMSQSFEESKSEADHLSKGISSFQEKQYDKAYLSFREAIDVNGSPLAYLYAALLVDDNNSARYFLIAALAEKHGAIDSDIYHQHVNYLMKEGYLEVSH